MSLSPPPSHAVGLPVMVVLLGTSLYVCPLSSDRQMKLLVVLKPQGAVVYGLS